MNLGQSQYGPFTLSHALLRCNINQKELTHGHK